MNCKHINPTISKLSIAEFRSEQWYNFKWYKASEGRSDYRDRANDPWCNANKIVQQRVCNSGWDIRIISSCGLWTAEHARDANYNECLRVGHVYSATDTTVQNVYTYSVIKHCLETALSHRFSWSSA